MLAGSLLMTIVDLQQLVHQGTRVLRRQHQLRVEARPYPQQHWISVFAFRGESEQVLILVVEGLVPIPGVHVECQWTPCGLFSCCAASEGTPAEKEMPIHASARASPRAHDRERNERAGGDALALSPPPWRQERTKVRPYAPSGAPSSDPQATADAATMPRGSHTWPRRNKREA